MSLPKDIVEGLNKMNEAARRAMLGDIIDRLLSGGGGGEVFYTNNNPVPNDVGGIGKGDTFDLQTMNQMWDRLLYPISNPTLTNPSMTLRRDSDRLVEVGAVFNFIVTSSFNRGGINPAFGTSGFRSGLPNTYNWSGQGLGNVSVTGLSNSQNVANLKLDTPQTITISCRVSYDAGEQPLDSDGNNYGTPLPSGQTAQASVDTKSVFVIYAKTANNTTMSRQVLTDAKQLQYTFAAEGDTADSKQSFQWHESVGNLAGIQQESPFNPGEWLWLGGSAAGSLALFAKEEVVVDTLIGPQTYYKFTNIGDKTGSRELRIIIS